MQKGDIRWNLELNIANIIILVMLSLAIIQFIALIFDFESVKVGPFLIIVVIGMAAGFSIAIIKNMLSGYSSLTKQDIVALLVIIALTVLVLFYLKPLVPEIFFEGVLQLESLVGLGG